MSQIIKYSKGLAHYAVGEGVPQLPYGETVLGSWGYNIANNFINIAYNRRYGDDIIFGSASKHIARRYLASLATRDAFYQLKKRTRLAQLKEIESFQNRWNQAKQNNKTFDRLVNVGVSKDQNGAEKPILEPKYFDEYSGELLESYLELSIPSTSGSATDKEKSMPPFVDSTCIIDTSSKKNVILTPVTHRDTSRKEYVSGGDIQINARGYITHSLPNAFPDSEIRQFLFYMEHGGVLRAQHLALKVHNIDNILVTDFRINYKAGNINNVEYSFSAVGVAQSKETLYINRISDEITTKAGRVNRWLISEPKKTNEPTKKNDKIYNFIERWL